MVKRVIGTEGDLVCLRSNASVSISTDWAWTDGMGGAWRERERRGKGREVRKGKEMGRGDIVGKKDIDVPGGFRRAIEVPKGHIWVEGDEGFHSGDSNDFGPVSRKEKKRTFSFPAPYPPSPPPPHHFFPLYIFFNTYYSLYTNNELIN